MFDVGTLLADKYRVDRVIGRGGMGVVVAATHVGLQHPVALKFLLPEMLRDEHVVARFVREARSSAQLRGMNVCRVADVGTLENGSPYIVMELLEGRDLASLVDEQGALPVHVVTEYVLQACLGVAEAHALGIVHRDLKPGNLFLTRAPDGGPLIKVLDFGIAKAQSDVDFRLTTTSSLLGSPNYMSPEQLRSSRDVDLRSDIWALGVILYELASARMPFTGETLTEIALRVAMDPTPPLPRGLPYGFDALIYRCLAKDPALRYDSVASLAHALVPYGGGGAWQIAAAVSRMLGVAPPSYGHDTPTQIAAPAPIAAPVAFARPPTPQPGFLSPVTASYPKITTIGSSTGSYHAPPPARRASWPVIAAAAVVALAISGVVLVRGGSSTPEPAAAPPPAAVEPARTAKPANPVEPARQAAARPTEPAPVPDAIVPAVVRGEEARPQASRARQRPRPAAAGSAEPSWIDDRI